MCPEQIPEQKTRQLRRQEFDEIMQKIYDARRRLHHVGFLPKYLHVGRHVFDVMRAEAPRYLWHFGSHMEATPVTFDGLVVREVHGALSDNHLSLGIETLNP